MNYIQRTIEVLRELLPDQSDEFLEMYALVVLIKGHSTTLRDVHDAWAIVRNRTNPDHANLVDFSLLDAETRAKDRLFRAVVHQAVDRLTESPTR